jgi:hypothetical protein
MKERTRAMTAPAGRVVRSAAQGIRTFGYRCQRVRQKF